MVCTYFHPIAWMSLSSSALPSQTKDISSQISLHVDTRVSWCLRRFGTCACSEYVSLFSKLYLFEIGKLEAGAGSSQIVEGSPLLDEGSCTERNLQLQA